MKPGTKRAVRVGLLGVAGVLAMFIARPTYLVVNAWLHDRPALEITPAGFADDASRLNRTRIMEVVDVPADPAAAEAQLRDLLRRARAERLPVAIAGAKHTMGGHTIAPDGVVVNMLPFNRMELDEARNTLHVGAGARWSAVIPYLDARGRSVAVMQSNNDFSVGGSLGANCHGWQVDRPPIASTVESFRLMTADGTVRRCSRTENAELFSLVLGGYGLFGIVLDVELRVVPNARYRAAAEVLPTARYAERFRARVDADTGMAYGRLCVAPGPDFLREAILTTFHPAPGDVPPLAGVGYTGLRREVYRAQLGSPAGRQLRWKAERAFGERVRDTAVSRNQLLNEPAEVYQERNADRTDVLHEYFVPYAQVESFLERARAILPRHAVELMNVTVRNVLTDDDAFLRYADQDLFAFVLLFNQPRAPDAEPIMAACTRELIDAALDCGGRYYLPYRLHATPAQFRRAYPQATTFFAKQRQYDPDGLFQNQFSRTYGK